MVDVAHSDWMFEHSLDHHSDAPVGPHAETWTDTSHLTATDSVSSVLKTLWYHTDLMSGGSSHAQGSNGSLASGNAGHANGSGKGVAPTLTVNENALTVDGGGSVALPVSVSPSSGHHETTSVTITGLPSFETVTDTLDGKTFSGSSITLSAAEVNSGLSLASDYTGAGHPVDTLTLTATETIGHHTLTSAPQTIAVTDPAASSSSTISPSGSVLVAGSHGSLVTSDGTWSFSTSTAAGGNVILLNGAPATDGAATTLLVEQGHVYADNAQGNWYEWVSANWAQTASAPATASANGSTLAAGSSGSLVTSDGIWTFGTGTAAGGNVILLDGVPATNGAATTLFVEQGHLYADNAQGNWYQWVNSNWVQTTEPTLSTAASGSTLVAGTAGSLVTSDGMWSFSPSTAAGGNVILLNDVAASNGAAATLVVEQGHLYADNVQGNWYEWVNANWVHATDPLPTTGSTTGTTGGTTGTSGSTGTGTGSVTGSTGSSTGSSTTPPSEPGFYVSPTGSDSNAGTLAAPFATLAHAEQAMENSSVKTTYVEAGTYNLSSTLTLTAADDGETWSYYAPNGVNTAVLNGGGSLSPVISITGGASNITIDGIKVENFGQIGIDAGGEGGEALVTKITVENCDVGNGGNSGNTTAGILFENVADSTIENNYVHNMQGMGISLYAYYSGESLNGDVIENNVVLNTVQGLSDGGAIYVDMDGTGTSGGSVAITDNFVRDYGAPGHTDAHGIYLDDNASNVTVTNNVIGPPTVGAGGNSQSAYLVHNGANDVFSGNIVDLGSSGQTFAAVWYKDGGSGMSGDTFTNNIVVSDLTGSQHTSFSGVTGYTFYENSAGSNFTIADNVYYNYSGGQVLTDGPDASDSSPILENPMLSGDLYSVASNSPAFSSAVSFKAIAGNWGPPGFTIPTSTNASDE
jgi:hypothetical protein